MAREHEALGEARALILDLLNVPLLSTTVALAVENVVRDARSAGVAVFVCAAEGESRQRLEKIEKTGSQDLHFCLTRSEALRKAVTVIEEIEIQAK